VLALVAGAALALWSNRQRVVDYLGSFRGSQAALRVAADRIDPANEGRAVRVAGNLEITGPARDEQFGVTAAAAVLLRTVHMYQWIEHCKGDDCSYAAAWSAQPVDSRAFRHPQGHDNPSARLADARFAAQGIHLGAWTIPAELAAAQLASVEFPVHVAELPPNLAASFSDAGGALHAGGDPSHPQVGELRVSYRIVPTGKVDLGGVQRGSILAVQ